MTVAAHDVRVVPRRTRVAVALGGGGARGYAHIGILEVLGERGYDVVTVAGSSMGALTGGLFAADRLEAYSEWVRGLTHRDVLRLYDLSPRAPGAIRAEKIFARVADILGAVRIENLRIPFTAVATDLTTGEEVWFRDGPLSAALRASAALPGFMTPVVVDGRLLADGGLTNPLPLAPVASAHADVTVGVVVSGPSTRRAPARQVGRTPERLPAGLRTFDVVELSMGAVRAAVLRHALAAHPPDALVTIPRSSCRTLDFHRADELIALGRRLAIDALDRAQLDRPGAADGRPA